MSVYKNRYLHNIYIYHISYMHIQSYTYQSHPAPFNSNSHNTHHHRSTSSNFGSSIGCANQQPARSKAVQGAYTKHVVMHDPLREIPWLPRIRLESSKVRQRFRYRKKMGPFRNSFVKTIWVFPKIGVPQNGWFIIENPIKVDDLGVPSFKETSICNTK